MPQNLLTRLCIRKPVPRRSQGRSFRPTLEALEDRLVFSVDGQFITSRWSTWDTNNQMQVLSGDFDGDRKTDVMKFDVPVSGSANLGLWVGLSRVQGDGTQFFDTSRWSTWTTYQNMKTLAGDFDGDGRSDVMKFDVPSSGSSTNGLWVGLSRTRTDGSRFFDTSEWARWTTYRDMKVFAGDFDGDGRTDVMKFDVPSSGTSQNGLWVGLSRTRADGTFYFDTQRWATWDTNVHIKVLTGDFDGDGKTDIMKFDVPSSGSSTNGLWVGLSRTRTDGSRFFDTAEWARWTTYRDMKVFAGDFDGDGRTDVMKFDVTSGTNYSSSGLWVGASRLSSTGVRSFDTRQWATWDTATQMKVLTGDFNGDGKTDIMKFDVPATGTSRLGLWVGISDAKVFHTSRWESWDANTPMKVLGGDFNGDGYGDVMKFDVPSSGTSQLGLWVGLSRPGLPVPVYNSRPGAPATLFLDFNGHTEPSVLGHNNVTTPAFDMDGNRRSFNTTELNAIQEIWQRVAEDFAPFNINVSTEQPPSLAPGVAESVANRVALRVAIGGSNADWYGGGGSGVAPIGAFTDGNPNVVYVWSQDIYGWGLGNASVATTVSHEAGHGFGLLHQRTFNADGTVREEYNPGTADWTPIMGDNLASDRTTWHNGTTTSTTTFQDEMAVLANSTNGFGYRPDDYGDSMTAAFVLPSGSQFTQSGIIGRMTDQDYFRFRTTGGTVTLTLNVAAVGPNLDSMLELYDSTGKILARSAPVNSLGASITQTLVSGTYYAVVRSRGVYGDVGQYTLSGSGTFTSSSTGAVSQVQRRIVTTTTATGSSGGVGFGSSAEVTPVSRKLQDREDTQSPQTENTGRERKTRTMDAIFGNWAAWGV